MEYLMAITQRSYSIYSSMAVNAETPNAWYGNADVIKLRGLRASFA